MSHEVSAVPRLALGNEAGHAEYAVLGRTGVEEMCQLVLCLLSAGCALQTVPAIAERARVEDGGARAAIGGDDRRARAGDRYFVQGVELQEVDDGPEA